MGEEYERDMKELLLVAMAGWIVIMTSLPIILSRTLKRGELFWFNPESRAPKTSQNKTAILETSYTHLFFRDKDERSEVWSHWSPVTQYSATLKSWSRWFLWFSMTHSWCQLKLTMKIDHRCPFPSGWVVEWLERSPFFNRTSQWRWPCRCTCGFGWIYASCDLGCIMIGRVDFSNFVFCDNSDNW